ncbi:endothelial cell-specific chemotaxis regulator isoform X2 [Polypterus senegalus]|uniref:endothelial cell-specific chemotaxis regulator isoform X2 n=1 Tax=Polypterus senegalus TaxID=55291 RepID=UPI0019650CA8|nr:endothelial cell-specific chemotaxis regulator isoform X2 [Polypterus senegalus]
MQPKAHFIRGTFHAEKLHQRRMAFQIGVFLLIVCLLHAQGSDRTSTITPPSQGTNSNTTPISASTKAGVTLNDTISSASPSMKTPGMTSTTEKITGNVTSAKKELCGVMCQTTGMPASDENSTSITTSPSTKTSRHMATMEMTSTVNPKTSNINVSTTATSSEDLDHLQHQTESISQNKTNNETDVSVFPAGQTDNKLKMVAFVVMVILVSVVNLRGKCRGSKEADGKKIGDSVVSESNATINGEKESITLISMKSLITETDSPRMSCIFRSPESEDGDLSIDAYSAKYI